MWSLVLFVARLKVKMQASTTMLCFKRDLHMDALSMKFLIYMAGKRQKIVYHLKWLPQVVASSDSFLLVSTITSVLISRE